MIPYSPPAGTVRVDVGVGRKWASWFLSHRAEKAFTLKSLDSNIYRLIRCKEPHATLRWESCYLISSHRTLRVIWNGHDTHRVGSNWCELNRTSRATRRGHGEPWGCRSWLRCAHQCCMKCPHSLERERPQIYAGLSETPTLANFAIPILPSRRYANPCPEGEHHRA